MDISSKNPIEEVKELATSIGDDKIARVLIDTSDGLLDPGTGKELADAFRARYFKLDDLSAELTTGSIRDVCS
ncbi:MAG: hypothetical protein ACXQTK_00655 [Candidatus Syntropharchaeales archaeon]